MNNPPYRALYKEGSGLLSYIIFQMDIYVLQYVPAKCYHHKTYEYLIVVMVWCCWWEGWVYWAGPIWGGGGGGMLLEFCVLSRRTTHPGFGCMLPQTPSAVLHHYCGTWPASCQLRTWVYWEWLSHNISQLTLLQLMRHQKLPASLSCSCCSVQFGVDQYWDWSCVQLLLLFSTSSQHFLGSCWGSLGTGSFQSFSQTRGHHILVKCTFSC